MNTRKVPNWQTGRLVEEIKVGWISINQTKIRERWGDREDVIDIIDLEAMSRKSKEFEILED